jgi:hypothetical protein
MRSSASEQTAAASERSKREGKREWRGRRKVQGGWGGEGAVSIRFCCRYLREQLHLVADARDSEYGAGAAWAGKSEYVSTTQGRCNVRLADNAAQFESIGICY